MKAAADGRRLRWRGGFGIGTLLAAAAACGFFTASGWAADGSDAAEARARALVARMTLAEKLSYLGGVDSMSIRAIPRLGIPAVRMADGPVGVREPGPSTRYPAGAALAATWDPELARAEGAALGRDCRARGIGILLAPAINLHRVPVNGRNFEYVSGEDPLLASRLVVPLVQGLQGEGVMATVKHFAANNQEFNRTSIDVQVGERALRELYLPAFEAAVREGGAGAVMDAYNRLNGVFCTENAFLNRQLLRDEWGFTGIVMSDWGATHSTLGAFRGGLDLEMPAGAHFGPAALAPLLRAGEISLGAVDAKVVRILTTLGRFGLLDRPSPAPFLPARDPVNEGVARAVATAGCVLLKNDGELLPLSKARLRRVAVVGASAHPGVPGGGGSSRVAPTHAVSVWEGLRDALGPAVAVELLPAPVVTYAGTRFSHPDGKGGHAAGLLAEYYPNDELEGAPSRTQVDGTIDFGWGPAGPLPDGVDRGRFSVRWRGEITPESDGETLLQARSDDAMRVYVDGRLALDDWQDHAVRTTSATVTLTGGQPHDLRVEYRNRGGSAVAQFGYAPAVVPAGVRDADLVVACIGYDETSEGEGFDRPFTLPAGQDDLVEALERLNPRTVAILFAGGGADLSRWLEWTPALIHAWYPGQEGGAALADLLVGDANFSGKLPVTFDRRFEDAPAFSHYPSDEGGDSVEYAEGVFLGYRGAAQRQVPPLFPFGFGLSYTRFRYDDLRVEPTPTARGWLVRFQLTNVGSRAGAEVAQLYVAPPPSPVARPLQELKGFAKIALAPGESRDVALTVGADALRYFDVASGRWCLVPGTYEFRVGGSSADLPLRATAEAGSKEEVGDADGS